MDDEITDEQWLEEFIEKPKEDTRKLRRELEAIADEKLARAKEVV